MNHVGEDKARRVALICISAKVSKMLVGHPGKEGPVFRVTAKKRLPFFKDTFFSMSSSVLIIDLEFK